MRMFWLLIFLAAGLSAAAARTVTDMAGRTITVPDTISRVFAAGPPASTLLYVVAPQTMIGWVRTPRENEKPFLLPEVRSLPELGRLTGRGDTLNLERLMANRPDVIIDFGTVSSTYRSLADRVQAQTGIPYIFVDGRFDAMPAALRLVGDEQRGERLAQAAERILAAADEGLAVLFSTHEPEQAFAVADRVVALGAHGHFATGLPDAVLTSAQLTRLYGVGLMVEEAPSGRRVVSRARSETK
jgi:iron complex transport system substrate-binding protein